MENKLLQIIEAALLSASRPLSIEEILKIFPEDEAPTKENIKSALEELELLNKNLDVLNLMFQKLV